MVNFRQAFMLLWGCYGIRPVVEGYRGRQELVEGSLKIDQANKWRKRIRTRGLINAVTVNP
jgi:hypothetical protein